MVVMFRGIPACVRTTKTSLKISSIVLLSSLIGIMFTTLMRRSLTPYVQIENMVPEQWNGYEALHNVKLQPKIKENAKYPDGENGTKGKPTTNRSKDKKLATLLVDTPMCQIPDFDAYDDSIKSFIEDLDKNVHCDKYPQLTYTIGSTLYINRKVGDDKNSNYTNAQCCYKYLHRDESSKRSDDQYRYSPRCEFIDGDSFQLNSEYSRVSCYTSDLKHLIYENFHAVVLWKPSVEKRRPKSKLLTKNDYRVMLIGLDCVSRLNFHRQLKRTKKLLVDKLGAIELLGYNKVGHNTFPNIIPLTTGLSVEELQKSCWKNDKDSFDRCDFLWTHAHKYQYKTMYCEDSASISSYNYVKNGFYRQPTDYYPRPIMLAAEKNIGYNKPMNCKTCVGPITAVEFLLKYTYEFYETLKQDKLFSLTWLNSLTHDDLNWPSKADNYVEQFFTNMTASGALDRTIVMFVSDHGIRWGGITSTYIGQMEERLPFAFIYLPPHFRKNHPEMTQTMKINTRRLLTPYDIYATAKDVMNGLGSDVVQGSLLRAQVSKMRSCADAKIPVTWCACHHAHEEDLKAPHVGQAARLIVDSINEMVKSKGEQTKCAKLTLKKITSANMLVSNQTFNAEIKNEGNELKYLLLSIVTIPGESIFSAGVRVTNNTATGIIGQIGRSNLYGNQSHCTEFPFLKAYCFCNS